MHSLIVEAICQRLATDAPVALLGTPSLSAQLRLRAPDTRLLLVVDRRHPRRPRLPTLSADAGALPLALRSLAAIVAVNALGRTEDPAEVLRGWSLALKPRGQLIVAEDARALTPWRRHLAPEDLTAGLLNAGFAEIGQIFQGNTVLTRGRWGTTD